MLDYWFLGDPASWFFWSGFWIGVAVTAWKREPILAWLEKHIG